MHGPATGDGRPASSLPDPRPSGTRIVVVGDVNLDVVAVAAGEVRVGTDTPASVTMTGGGSAANTAAWAAAAGAAVTLVAATGDDDAGRTVRAELEASEVDLAGPLVAGVRTGTCVVLVGPDRERTMLPDRGANDALDPATVERAVGAASDVAWLHLSGYALLHEGSREAGTAALDAARGHGLRSSVDAASAGPIHDLGASRVLDLVDGVDILFANDDEVAALGGRAAILRRVGALVHKRGGDGATWVDSRGAVDVPAVAVTSVDTTGAGDALAAGWLAATVGGAGPVAALSAGAALAARAVAAPGARP